MPFKSKLKIYFEFAFVEAKASTKQKMMQYFKKEKLKNQPEVNPPQEKPKGDRYPDQEFTYMCGYEKFTVTNKAKNPKNIRIMMRKGFDPATWPQIGNKQSHSSYFKRIKTVDAFHTRKFNDSDPDSDDNEIARFAGRQVRNLNDDRFGYRRRMNLRPGMMD